MLATIKSALAALPPLEIKETEFAAKGFHLDVQVAPEQVVDVALALDDKGFFLEAVTGVDWLGEKEAALKEAAKKKEKEAEAGDGAAQEAAPAPEDLVDEMEVVYDYSHFESLCHVVVRTRVKRDDPELPTVSGVFPGANWHERETHDFFGIRFAGHPDLSPLLLPEDADFHPLRKDYRP